jgi:glycyl-tRNA synthetase beta chain
MASFLLELFSEEIPARMQTQAAEHLAHAFAAAVKEAGLPVAAVKTFVTPRRLALACDGLPAAQPDVNIEKKGPKTGAPQAAIDGFLRSAGVPLEKLEKRMVGKDETYFAVIRQKGQPTATVLKSIVEKIIGDFPWPKSMRWGARETRWVRPLHSILCLMDGKVVPVEWGGITAGNVTYGHRFLSPEAITVATSEDYEGLLEKAHVIADAAKRKAEIAKQAEALAAKHGLSVKRDDGLLAEVNGLVEWPTLLMGSIDARFMDLPPEVLVSEMRAHQKYFALLTGNGAMSDKFLITSNMVTSDGGKAVIAGNERVLRARLSDGRFFWDQDRKKPLSEWAKGLEGVTFHAKIGTIAQKVERVTALAVQLCEYVKGADKKLVERAARLCKADLTTGMVGEFPELQGVMGRYYALAQKEDAAVADAIRDHYLPLGPDSPVPTKSVSICVALADKLDTLISMFAAGEKPTGSKDPFALRRSALGIIRIILENNLRLPLKKHLNDELLSFFYDRLIVQLKDKGTRHDVIKAIVSKGDDNLIRVVSKAKAVQDFLETEDGNNLLIAYKRAANIVNAAEQKDKTKYTGQIDYKDSNEYASALAKALSNTLTEMKRSREIENFSQMMNHASDLRKPIDAFFTNVLVNAEEPELRISRLNLLAWIRDAFEVIADFSLIEG